MKEEKTTHYRQF